MFVDSGLGLQAWGGPLGGPLPGSRAVVAGLGFRMGSCKMGSLRWEGPGFGGLDSVTRALVGCERWAWSRPPSAVAPKDSCLRCLVGDPTEGLEFGANTLIDSLDSWV